MRSENPDCCVSCAMVDLNFSATFRPMIKTWKSFLPRTGNLNKYNRCCINLHQVCLYIYVISVAIFVLIWFFECMSWMGSWSSPTECSWDVFAVNLSADSVHCSYNISPSFLSLRFATTSPFSFSLRELQSWHSLEKDVVPLSVASTGSDLLGFPFHFTKIFNVILPSSSTQAERLSSAKMCDCTLIS